MTNLNSSLNNLRGRSSDGRGSMPNLPSNGALPKGVSGFAGNFDDFVKKQQEELDEYAQKFRFLTQSSPSSRIPTQATQSRVRPLSRERGSGVSLAGTRKKSNYTSPSSEDDGGNDDEREISKKTMTQLKLSLVVIGT